MISIIIPVFNRETTLSSTLQSLKDQTYQDWECLLVDDGSTDSSFICLKKEAEMDARFRLFQRPINRTKGPSSSRNIGLENAVGDFVIYLDSDDILAPFCLAERLNTFKVYPNNDFLVFGMKIFSQEIPKINREELSERNKQNWLSNFIQLRGSWQTTAPIYKIDFARNIGGFSESIMIFEDFEIAIKALFNSDKYTVFNNIDYFYRNDESYFLKHKDIVYSKKVVEAYLKFIDMVHYNVIIKATKEGKVKYKKDSIIAYQNIFNRYIIRNVKLFKKQNKEIITFLFKMDYINKFTYTKYLIVQHFLFQFHKIKGLGLYRLITYLMQ